ncbi:MAG: serine/threonine-protein kinase [Gammaproteobacteria bacterium]|nr:serine/threonine-protein kinase [Gammaproteobacteria bacterium]
MKLEDLTIVKALVPPKSLVAIQQVVDSEDGIHVTKSYATKRLLQHQQRNNIDLLGNEIKYLTMLSDCPWVVDLKDVWKTHDSVHLVLEHCAGGDLLDYLFMFGPCNLWATQFYMSEIIVALEQLHKRNIMHGDMKPDNVFIGSDGHIKLGDFGMACAFKHPLGRTTGKRGTKEYWSPLQHRHMPFGIKNDIWGLGCILFMLLTNVVPFTGYRSVRDREGVCRKAPISARAKDLLMWMWTAMEQDRIELSEIKRHPFFEGLDWDKVGSVQPPWTPNETDRSMLYADGEYAVYDLLQPQYEMTQPFNYLDWINGRRSLSGDILPFQLNILEEKLNAERERTEREGETNHPKRVDTLRGSESVAREETV